MGAAAYKHYRNTFTIRRFEENMAGLFGKLLGMESTPGAPRKFTMANR